MRVVGRIRRHPQAVIAATLLAAEIFVALLAPALAPHDPNAIQPVGPFKPVGTPGYLLGTDDIGRDLLSRLIYGGRMSIGIGFATVACAAAIGIPLGLLAGYYIAYAIGLVRWRRAHEERRQA